MEHLKEALSKLQRHLESSVALSTMQLGRQDFAAAEKTILRAEELEPKSLLPGGRQTRPSRAIPPARTQPRSEQRPGPNDARRMPCKAGHTLQFRIEAFNAINHPNWGMPRLNILSGPTFPGQPATNAHQTFGVISCTSTSMRQMQLKSTF